MKPFKNRVLAALVTIALVLVPAAGATAGIASGGKNNTVVVRNGIDDSLRSRSKVSVTHNRGPNVTNRNVANARSSCVDCRTVAVAAQVVLVEGPVDTEAPVNAAVAVNVECSSCETYAYARQVVLKPGSPVTIGSGARDRISAVHAEIRRISRSDLTFPEMDAALDRQVNRLTSIVEAEIAKAGETASKRDRKVVDEDRADH
ncbi:MAG TPA: hypothetical protein VHL54_04370 [Actinomycetota bacterium]|nr:hypothetical protein [Actinomycetota bacterium]